jgi:serine protease Do
MKMLKISTFIVSLILILSLALSTGCGLFPEIETETPVNPSANSDTTPINPDWTPPIESPTSVLPSIADVVAKVKPSVVAINTEIVTLDFFNRPQTQEGAGSGWIIDENGIIVTNNHVVEGAESITITMDDGRTFPVDISTVATDWITDLAILKIEAENLPTVSVGDSSKLRVGDWVVAIGNSLGERISATSGIVSALEVSLPVSQDQTLNDLVQTDAAINPGNSGGPLVNMAGEVIGITSVKVAEVGVEGMGYAISTNTAMPIIEDLITVGYAIRPWLGVGTYTVNQFAVIRYNLAVDEGVLITYVTPGSPADNAGLKSGDVITKFADQDVTSVNELLQAIHSSQVGQTVEITYWRGETQQTTSTTLIKTPPPS